MPTITETGRAQPKNPEERQIAASTCLTQCLYNIPPGVITASLPGLSILVTGVVLVALTATAEDPSTLAEGLPFLAVVVAAVGGGWTTLAVGFWLVMSCYRLKVSPKTTTKSGTWRQHSDSIELISVSWSDDGHHLYDFQNKST